MKSIFSLRPSGVLENEVGVRTDWNRGFGLVGEDGIPKQGTFLPMGDLYRASACEEQHARMDVRDEERMPDADLGELAMPETFLLQVLRSVPLLYQYPHAERA